MVRAPLNLPLGPSGVFTTARFLNTSGLSFAAVRYALIGLQIIDPLPEAMKRLLELSSQPSTSSFIVCSDMYQAGIAGQLPFTCRIDCDSLIQGPCSFSSRVATWDTSTSICS